MFHLIQLTTYPSLKLSLWFTFWTPFSGDSPFLRSSPQQWFPNLWVHTLWGLQRLCTLVPCFKGTTVFILFLPETISCWFYFVPFHTHLSFTLQKKDTPSLFLKFTLVHCSKNMKVPYRCRSWCEENEKWWWPSDSFANQGLARSLQSLFLIRLKENLELFGRLLWVPETMCQLHTVGP